MAARLAVLVSGSGSNLQALIDADDLGASIELVVSDRPGVQALERAERAGIASAVVDFSHYRDRQRWDAALFDTVASVKPTLTVSAGFMRILSAAYVVAWPTINIHPSLLPAFPGAHAVADALAYGVKVTGTTVHFVDEQVDHGPIISQGAVEVRPQDTVAALHARIKDVEHRLLPEAVRLFCADRLRVEGRVVKIESAESEAGST